MKWAALASSGALEPSVVSSVSASPDKLCITVMRNRKAVGFCHELVKSSIEILLNLRNTLEPLGERLTWLLVFA